MTAWGDLVHKLERIGRALLRFLAGARRGRRGVPAHVVPGPPRHWVERVREGAPGLLDPPAREQHAHTPPERPTQRMPLAPRAAGARRAPAVTQLQRVLRQVRRSVPLPRTPPPAGPATPYTPPPAPAAETQPPDATVRHDPPSAPGPPRKAAAVTERRTPHEPPVAPSVPARPRVRAAAPRPVPEPSEPADRNPATDSSWTPPRRPVPIPRSIPGQRPLPVARPVPEQRPLAVPLLAEPVPPPVRDSTAAARTPLELVRPAQSAAPIAAPPPRSWKRTPATIAAAHSRSWAHTPARAAATRDPVASIVGDPWPELPPPAVPTEADPGATLRAWQRERRLDREQADL